MMSNVHFFSNISKSVCTVLVIKVNTSCSKTYTGLLHYFKSLQGHQIYDTRQN